MTRRVAVPLCLLFCAVVGAACADADMDPISADAEPDLHPALALLEPANGHFSFLAPLGSGTKSGVFNPRLAPVVEVCRLAADLLNCGDVVARFTTRQGTQGEKIEVRTQQEQYHVTWNLAKYALASGRYRIAVLTAPSSGAHTVFGYADVAIAPTSKEARALADATTHAATSSSDIALKFRIEEGALCESSYDCFEGVVDERGGTFVTNLLQGGTEIPAFALDGQHTLVIERVRRDDVPFCLPTYHPQYEGCYRFTLEPEMEQFNTLVTVGVCLDPTAWGIDDQLELQKWDEQDPATLTSLERVTVDYLDCDGFMLSSLPPTGLFTRLARAAETLLTPVTGLLAPAPLLAGTSPFGGKASEFSRIGWVRPLVMEAAAGDDQTLCVATSVEPAVRTTSRITGEPVESVPVDFTVTAGGGFTVPASAASDGDGYASTSWTLGAAPGLNALRVDGSNPRPFWPGLDGVWGGTNFGAAAVAPDPYDVEFLTPIGASEMGGGIHLPGLSPTLRFCQLDASGTCIAGTIQLLSGFSEDATSGSYKRNWTAPTVMSATAVYRLDILIGVVVAGGIDVREGDNSKDSPDDGVFLIESGRTVPVKVHIFEPGC